jgi:hypothetical protein
MFEQIRKHYISKNNSVHTLWNTYFRNKSIMSYVKNLLPAKIIIPETWHYPGIRSPSTTFGDKDKTITK